MVEKILNNTTPYGKIRASHEGSLHSSTLSQASYQVLCVFTWKNVASKNIKIFVQYPAMFSS